MSHGKMMSPEKANSNQLFSQRHAAIRFIGAAKLPWIEPARTTNNTPHITVPLIFSLRDRILPTKCGAEVRTMNHHRSLRQAKLATRQLVRQEFARRQELKSVIRTLSRAAFR